MSARRPKMSRQLQSSSGELVSSFPFAFENPRTIMKTVISFADTALPTSVVEVLAQAFWSHYGVNQDRSVLTAWANFRVFLRFAHEKSAIVSVADLDGELLLKYVEWLNLQTKPNGSQWSKSSRYGAYGVIRTLLRWTERCRPGVLLKIEYPINPFPWKNRDTPPMERISAARLRNILRACEHEIAELRARRAEAQKAQVEDAPEKGSLGWLLKEIGQEYGGVLPSRIHLDKSRSSYMVRIMSKHGGISAVEPLLYPRSDSLLPYYISILIHAAGNPEPIASLRRDCLQAIPLLADRQALVWFKARAHSMQRRTFDANDSFEPPALVRDVLEWNERLVPMADAKIKNDLFLYKSARGITVLTCACIKILVRKFCQRHGLERFSLASLRPSVLTSFYRVSGDLRAVKNIANHAHLSTTVRYVDAPETQVKNRMRVSDLQHAFVGHIERPVEEKKIHVAPAKELLPGAAVSMFGFDCKDPFAGTAPGSHRGKMCAQFMGCFTCPNAVITSEPNAVARLLQAREHLRTSMRNIHPSRWTAIYAPQLQILELDILPRFSEAEIEHAAFLVNQLPSLPELR